MRNVFRGLARGLLRLSLIFLILFETGVLIPVAHSLTPAHTLVQNFATVEFVMSGVPETTISNVANFRVDELISFTLTPDNPAGVVVPSPYTGAVLSYTLSNQGNGVERFTLSNTQSVADDFDVIGNSIFLDSNSNGVYDTGIDLVYNLGINDPLLSIGAHTKIFIVSDIPAALATTDESKLSLTVNSATGIGPVGTVFNGLGDGGVDATLGSVGSLSIENRYVITSAAASLVKSQSILDPNGGNFPVPNAVVTYTLVLNVTGAGNLTSVNIADLIPAGSAYVANSLTLDTVPLTDAADPDAGVFTGTGIQISLGTVSAPTTHTATFKVRIQ